MIKVRSVRVFSVAKVNAILYGILGLILAPFFLIGPGLAVVGAPELRRSLAGIVLLTAFVPFFYAIFGFIFGALIAFIYNAISHAVGGIEIELDLSTLAGAPAPQQIAAPPLSALPARPEFE
jgi:hypothetical protein